MHPGRVVCARCDTLIAQCRCIGPHKTDYSLCNKCKPGGGQPTEQDIAKARIRSIDKIVVKAIGILLLVFYALCGMAFIVMAIASASVNAWQSPVFLAVTWMSCHYFTMIYCDLKEFSP